MDIKGSKVIVTGGAGFIGSHLVDRLISLETQVTIIDNLSFGFEKNVNPKANFIQSDVCDYIQLHKIISNVNPNLIFHLAANATTKETSMGWADPTLDYQINAGGTLNVLKAITDINKNCHVIFASSAAVYGEPEYTAIDEKHPTNPISPYGISKLAGEKYCFAYNKEQGIRTTALRIFNTYGSRQPRYVMFDLIKKLKENPHKLEIIGTGEQIRDYCYISDTVDAFIQVIEKGNKGEVFNVAHSEPISIRSIAEQIIKLLDLEKITKVYYTGKSWKGDITRLYGDISKISQEVGFKPKVSLDEGLKKLIDYFSTN